MKVSIKMLKVSNSFNFDQKEVLISLVVLYDQNMDTILHIIKFK
jgi:hypothetical protein